MKITLRLKFIILSVVLVFVVMTAITYFYTIRELDSKQEAVESQIRRIAQNIATMQLLDQQDWGVYQNYISQLMAFNQDIVYIAIYDDRYTLRAHALNTDLIEIDRPVLTRRIEANIVKRLDEGQIAADSRDDLRTERVNIQVGERVLGSVHVGFSLIDINQKLRHGIRFNIALALIFLIIFSSASIFISRHLTRPLEKLTTAMEAVSEGDLGQKVEPETQDEIAQLTLTFNEMIDGLRERQIIEDLGNELSATFRLDKIAPLVSDRLSAAIGAVDARLYIRGGQNSNTFTEITTRSRNGKKYPPIILSNELKEQLRKEDQGFLIDSASPVVKNALNHSAGNPDGLVLPMTVKDEFFGLLFFELPSGQKHFDRKQQHFAATLSNQAAMALENALLYDELREQERLKRELEIAREVQKKLLPSRMPKLPGFDIDGYCKPAQEVGGDYFDFFMLDDRHLGVVVADVSGKGTSASFYMAEVKGMMLHLTSAYLSPKNLLIQLNRKIFEHIDRHSFITMVYGILDTKTGKFTLTRAGHNSIIKFDGNGSAGFVTPNGIGVGLESGQVFSTQLEEITLDLNVNDAIVIYTDGITEAMNKGSEFYGEDRLVQTLLKKTNLSAREIRNEVIYSVENFIGETPQWDDITLVTIKCNSELRN